MKYLNLFKKRHPVKKEDINILFSKIKENWNKDKNPYKISFGEATWRSEKYKGFTSKIISLRYNSLDGKYGSVFFEIIGNIINYKYDDVWSTAINVCQIWDSKDNDNYYKYKTIDGGLRESFIQAIIKMSKEAYDPIVEKNYITKGLDSIDFYNERKLIFDILEDLSDDYDFTWDVFRPDFKENRKDYEWDYEKYIKRAKEGNIMGMDKFYTKLRIVIESNDIDYLLQNDIFSRLENGTNFVRQTIKESDIDSLSIRIGLNYLGISQ